LVVWNRTPSVSETLQDEYPGRVTVARSASEVIGACDTTFSMLSTPEAAHEVFAAPSGVLAALEASDGPKSLVDCSTLGETDMQTFASAAREAGSRFLEAPVSGSRGPAAQGALIFMTAGDEALHQEVLPHLDAMGKASFFVGSDVGAATRMKLCLNMVMGSMLASLAEGVTLADSSEVDTATLLEIVSLGAMANPMFALKAANLAPAGGARSHPAHFPLKHAQKDVRLALELAEQRGVTLPVACSTHATMAAASDAGWGDADFSAVIEGLVRK